MQWTGHDLNLTLNKYWIAPLMFGISVAIKIGSRCGFVGVLEGEMIRSLRSKGIGNRWAA